MQKSLPGRNAQRTAGRAEILGDTPFLLFGNCPRMECGFSWIASLDRPSWTSGGSQAWSLSNGVFP
jgi:hypothetical protein